MVSQAMVEQPTNGPNRGGAEKAGSAIIIIRNDGMRAVRVISDVELGRERLMPGEALEIDAAAGSPEITLYDGGLQIDFGRSAGLTRYSATLQR